MKQHSAMRVLAMAAAAVAVSVAVPAQARSVNWDGGPDGSGRSWNDPVNWSGDLMPEASDYVNLQALPANSTVSLDAPQHIHTLIFPDWDQVAKTVGTTDDVAAGNTLTLTHVYRGTNHYGAAKTIVADLTLAADSHWNLESQDTSASLYVRGSIGGEGVSLIKTGGGTLDLSGANTYGTTIINSGTIKLDFNAGTAPTSNILNANSSVVLAGGTLQLAGKGNAANTQTVNGVTIANGASTLSISNPSGNTMLLDMGAITRQVGGTVNFGTPSTSNETNGFTSSTGNDVGGILGGYATVGGANWATNNGTNIVAFSSYVDDAWGAANNTNVTVDGAVSDGVTHSLRFNGAAARTLTLSGTNVIDSGGILVTSSVGANATAITGGTLTSGTGDLVVHQHNTNSAGAMTISSTIADNGANAVALTKSGGGTLILEGQQTYTGGTYVNAGTLQLTAGLTDQLSTTGNIVVSGGTLALGSGTVQNTTGDVVVRGGTISGGRINKTDGNYDVQQGTVSAVLAGTAGLVKTGAANATLSGANTYTGDTVVLEGKLSVTTGGAVKGNLVVGSPDGGPTATYSGSNDATFTSSKQVTVYANGTVNWGSAAQYTNGGVFIYGGSISGGQWYNQSSIDMYGGSIGGSIYGNDGLTIRVHENPAPATISANVWRSYTYDVADGEGLVDLAVTGSIDGSGKTLTKTGAGLMQMAGNNGYTGATNINDGTLWISGSGAINSTSSITVRNAAVFLYDSSVGLAKAPTLDGTATFIYDSPAKLGGDLTVGAGRTLGGSGSFAGVNVSGILSPGNSPGVMTIDSLVLNDTATTIMEIAGGADYDSIVITDGGSLQLGGTLSIVTLGGYDFADAPAYTLFSLGAGVAPVGGFSSVSVNGYDLVGDGGVWTGAQGANTYLFSEQTGVLSVAVPEPSIAGLAVLAACMGLTRRQRRA